jgi:DNA-binding NtrC family response regulator
MSTTLPDRIRVLHVDDEPGLAELTATFLEREDERLTVETATSAEEGLELFDEPRHDCVVSDYCIPGTDGLDFLRAVRQDHPELPFILYTAKSPEAIDCDSRLATNYLQKQPGTEQYERLADQIRDAVRSRHEYSRQADVHVSD